MTDQFRELIRSIISSETSAVSLSNKLFSPHGLFHVVAHTEAKRRELTKDPLFQEAQARLSELQLAEAEPLFAELEKLRAALNPTPANGPPADRHSEEPTPKS